MSRRQNGLLGVLRSHPVMSLAFALALALVLFFATGFVRHAIYWSDPAHQAQPLEGWMTPRYIANSWNVDGPELAKHLGVSEAPKERPTLQDIADKRGVPLETIIAIAESYLTAHTPPK